MKALKRTLHALPVLVTLWLIQLALAAVAGAQVNVAVSTALRGGGWLDDGHLLGALLELLSQNPSVGANIVASVMTANVLGFLLWVPMAGGLIERLAGHALGPGEILAGARWSLPMAAQTLWTWTGRALILGLVGVLAGKVAWFGILLPLVFVLFVLAFDYARARIILQDEKPFSPMSMLRALRDTLRQPLMMLGGALLLAAQLGAAQMPLWIAMHAQSGASTLLLIRLSSFLPLFFAAWRISVVIGRVEGRKGL